VTRLTPVSYIVLALLDEAGEATPYELKGMAASLTDLWALRHDQVYREPARLAAEGLLSEERETSGRRRRRFRLTDDGTKALAEWRRTPTTELAELRDPGLLQLFLDGDADALARTQLELHQRKVTEYEAMRETMGPDAPPNVVRAVNSGIGHEREYVRFWTDIGNGGDGAP